MEHKDILAIFNEMLTKVYSEQEEKYKRKRKYNLVHYCCSEEEKKRISILFEELLYNRNTMNLKKFLQLFQMDGE